MSIVGHSLRLAVRNMLRWPGEAMVVIVTLALGLGATSILLTLIDAVFLEALPYASPDRLMALEGVRRSGSEVEDWAISYPDLEDWRVQSRAFAQIAGYAETSFNASAGDKTFHLQGEMVTGNYLRTLGVPPALGKGFEDENDQAGNDRVALLGYGLWRSVFGGDATILGHKVRLDGVECEVVGVMPSGFQGLSDKAQIWSPLSLAREISSPDTIETRATRWIKAVGRLQPEVTLRQARQDLEAVTRQLAEIYPDDNRDITVRIRPLSEAFFGSYRPVFAWLLGSAMLVLAIACSNAGALLLADVARRRREFAICAAIGAEPRHLFCQVLIESLLVVAGGAAVGLVLAQWGTASLVTLAGMELPRFLQLAVHLRVIGLIVAIALVCSVALALAPAWIACGRRLGEALKEGVTSSARRHHLQSALIIAEVALVAVLSLSMALVWRGFQRFRHSDLGFRPQSLLTMRLDLEERSYREDGVRIALARQIDYELSPLPGLDSVALVAPAIPTDDWHAAPFTIEDRQDPSGTALFPRHHVSASYFTTMGIPLLRGRDFTAADNPEGEPVIVVSEALARRYWSVETAIGKRMKIGERDSPRPWRRVVGMVADAQHAGLRGSERPNPDVYVPLLQQPPRTPPIFNLLVRPLPGIEAAALAEPVRRKLEEIAPGLAPYDIATMEERLDRQISRDYLLAFLLALFTVVALGLAFSGVYSLAARGVRSRIAEIGIQLVLGATRGEIFRQVLRDAARLTLIGSAAGSLLAIVLASLLPDPFYGARSYEPWLLLGVSMTLVTVVVAGSLVPAIRATRVETTIILRPHQRLK